jgi:uncharacterized membrane protein YfcA
VSLLAAAAALAVGLVVGVVSGLTGIGGASFMIPFLYVLYARDHVPVGEATVVAHATSLAVIVPTAGRGILGYRRHHLIQWRAALPLGLVAGAAAAATAPFVPRLPGHALRVGFGCFLLLIAADLVLRSPEERPERAGRAHAVGSALLGVPVGMLSAALGIGGGVPATMGMYYLLGIPFEALVPTSLAVILFTASAGAASYLLTASPAHVPLPWLVGHVDLGHALPLAIGAVLTAPVGIWLNRRMPALALRRVFGAFLALVGADLVVVNAL